MHFACIIPRNASLQQEWWVPIEYQYIIMKDIISLTLWQQRPLVLTFFIEIHNTDVPWCNVAVKHVRVDIFYQIFRFWGGSYEEPETLNRQPQPPHVARRLSTAGMKTCSRTTSCRGVSGSSLSSDHSMLGHLLGGEIKLSFFQQNIVPNFVTCYSLSNLGWQLARSDQITCISCLRSWLHNTNTPFGKEWYRPYKHKFTHAQRYTFNGYSIWSNENFLLMVDGTIRAARFWAHSHKQIVLVSFFFILHC